MIKAFKLDKLERQAKPFRDWFEAMITGTLTLKAAATLLYVGIVFLQVFEQLCCRDGQGPLLLQG